MCGPSKYITRNADISAAQSSTLGKHETARVIAALKDGLVQINYQPVVRSRSNKFVAFYEGLARIVTPDGSIVAAGQFMPFIENTPLGTQLDRRILQMAIQQLTISPNVRLSINMSVLSMSDPSWLSVLEATDTDICERLIIEIIEGAAMSDVDLTTAFMNRIRRKYCNVALDDFGTGATSFRYFKDFRFDFVKIDGLFIRNLCYDQDNQVLVRALIDISKHFEMVTVAEFIETDGEAEAAENLGIDCLQGYLIGKPASLPRSPDRMVEMNIRIAG
ncbi:MAG: EAL domain-containing protein [Paracoccaceae bacterium]